MPYGTMSKITKEKILERAAHDGIDPDKLGLEPDIPNWDIEDSIPDDFPVKPVSNVFAYENGGAGFASCASCGLCWDDRIPTSYTPVPSGRCPFEAFHVSIPDNLYEISVIFGGALDESFYVETDYEVNIADWIADHCREESAKQDGEDWEVIVSTYAWEDAGEVRYRVSSWDDKS